jgi:hypothetical protein
LEESSSILESQKRSAWHDIVAPDESWFYFPTDYELIWLQPGEALPEKERPTIHSKKTMVTIARNPTGFQVDSVCGKRCKFDATHYITETLSLLPEWHKNQFRTSDRKLIVHSDHARPPTHGTNLFVLLDENNMTKSPHPFYSPNLAPSD